MVGVRDCETVGGATRSLYVEEEQVFRMAVRCSVIISLELRRTPRTLREETLSAPAMSGLANSGKRPARNHQASVCMYFCMYVCLYVCQSPLCMSVCVW